MKKYAAASLLIALIFSGSDVQGSFVTLFHVVDGFNKFEMEKQLWIEVHDVSPSYGYSKLEEILKVIERHPLAYSKVVLFVIPNHANSAPLHSYMEFAGKLSELQDRGYVLGVHGYAHPEPLKNFEFDTSAESAIALTEAAEREFKEAGLEFPSHFIAPGWKTSRSAGKYLRSKFDYVYDYFYIDTPSGAIFASPHEYTWYDMNMGALTIASAKWDYKHAQGVFRLSVHVGAANSAENLMFLDEFLGFVESENKKLS